ncbi:hypothetical protein ACJIZ3_014660 [Penstemon smallii]|uniref:RRM domain-containing protein n=1 Tax=Penstemon smallii TaxID=265156 RepID=A0ABD3RK81_9LAMI
MSTSGNPQFRYTQTPSKVLHLRNLPWDCTEEELVDLCKPFGKIVNTKCSVGANHNQAFVEFVDLNQAINMATYYASSSEPAQVRGKAVYIQYSNRHEIVNHKSPGDVPGNVLLVTIEGVEAGDVSIDVIHLVFSAFGFVHKIATFEKAAGFQALIQYSDVQTAAAARDSLDGRSIPRHIPSPWACKRLDYTNPYLPVNSTAMEIQVHFLRGNILDFLNFGQSLILYVCPACSSNVLLASIENMQYAVTVDVLHTVFSAFGTVQKIAIFEKNGGTQALIQYPDITTAAAAKDALEGHCIYDGGYCKLHLSSSRHTDLNVKAYSDKSRDYTVPISIAMQQTQQLPVSSWNPTVQAGGPTYMSAPSTYHGQIYSSAPVPYAATAVPPGTLPGAQPNHLSPGITQMRGTTHPGGVSYPSQPPYYGS